MIIVKNIGLLREQLAHFRKQNSAIGFVPTMGALHAGHLSLIEECKKHCDVTVASIFVNPTQFNNRQDFEKYPHTLAKDIALLEQGGCSILFVPTVDEMYPAGEQALHYELGYLETILEGKYRPGHFQGVCQIVDKLLQAVQPQVLFLGQKDYQQCMVVAAMIKLRSHPTQLRVCPTVREADGLAMSSRNMRLNENERNQALAIIRSLQTIKDKMKPGDVTALTDAARQYLQANGFVVDYVEIADAQNLNVLQHWDGQSPIVALAAAFVNDVRLIDNLALYP